MTPVLPTILLTTLVPRAEREEILADLTAEYAARAAADGRCAAGKWFWRQALASVLPLLGWAGRRALGLTGGQVVAQVMKQGVGLAALGILLGLAGTLVLSRLLTTLLYGVSTIDPIALAAASLVLLAIGAGAAFIPARRAGMTDPALVLREQ